MADFLLKFAPFLFLCAPLAAMQGPPVEIPPEAQSTYLVNKVAPVYPPLARQARIQGTVILRIVINKSGNVGNIQLFSGHPMLAPAAIDAVKQWKYRPYLVDGQPVEVETKVQVNFKLGEKPAAEGIVGDTPGGIPTGVIGSIATGNGGVRVSEGVMRAFRNQKIDPIYPPAAGQARIEGIVVLDVQINRSGEVEGATLISGHPMLAPAAIEAVKQWKYRPYLLNGDPATVDTIVSLNFARQEVSDADLRSAASGSSAPTGADGRGIPQRVPVSSGVETGLIVSKVAPHYPPEARDQHIQGVVLLRAIIDKEGNVSNLELISGDPTLAEAAIEAVKQWKYKPFLLNGDPVEVETQIQVNFTLRE